MKKPLCAFCILMLSAVVVLASEAEFNASKDTDVNEAAPDGNFGTSALINVWGGTGTPPVLDEMGMVEFFGLNELTAVGAEIDSAVLMLYITGLVSSGEVKIYRIGDEWVETDVTWNTRPDSNLAIVVVNTIPDQQKVWFETDVTEIVKSWVEEGYPNRGFYISVPPQGPNAQVGVQFTSKESPLDKPPKLWVEYHNAAIEEVSGFIPELRVYSLPTGRVEISLSLSHSINADLKVYDASGILVATLTEGTLASGVHNLRWNGQAGVYFIQLVTPKKVETCKVVLTD